MEMSLDRVPALGLTRALCVVVVALMVAAMAYAAWLALRYYGRIHV